MIVIIKARVILELTDQCAEKSNISVKVRNRLFLVNPKSNSHDWLKLKSQSRQSILFYIEHLSINCFFDKSNFFTNLEAG